MEYILENENLKMKVDDFGAELISLFDKINKKEIIWQKNKKYWNRSSPTLFPFIGAIKDKGYIYNGKKYEMSRHGFVRDVEFKLVKEAKDHLSFIYRSNENTIKMFPFKFEIFINYKLNKNDLKIEYILKNHSKEKMFYNLGGHTAYNFDISDGNKYIKFEEKEKISSAKFDLKTGLRLRDKFELLNNENTLKMSFDLFKHDTLLLPSLKSDYIILKDDMKKDYIKIEFSEFENLAIWTPNAPFVCIEPWQGSTDYIDENIKLKDKEDIYELAYKKKKTFSIVITVLNN